MKHYDRNGAQIACTCTKAEYDEQTDAEPVHVVRHDVSLAVEDR